MIIGIVGSRRRNSAKDKELVEQKLVELMKEAKDEVILCSGGCPKGADRFAEELAVKYNLKIIIYPADWERYGKGAGFMRNTDIAKTSENLIGCVAPDRTGGTEDTVKKFTKFHGGLNLHLV